MIPLMNVSRQYETIQKQVDEKALNILYSDSYIMSEDVSALLIAHWIHIQFIVLI